MKDNVILVNVARFIIPFILIYALYVQFHGEYSPGGGFQAGVIFASAFILYGFIYGKNQLFKILSLNHLRVISVFGVLLYFGTGIVTLLLGGKFLDYDVLISNNPQIAQQVGIVTIELGVGVTVFSVMLMILYLFIDAERK